MSKDGTLPLDEINGFIVFLKKQVRFAIGYRVRYNFVFALWCGAKHNFCVALVYCKGI